jgi:arsenate reductase (glutaredoxin)
MAGKTRIYEYANCSTCKKALQFLDHRKVSYEKMAIVERPPTVTELRTTLANLKEKGGTLKSLFNTSGVLYRELGMSEKLPNLTEAEALTLLSKHGKLIKRPLVLTDKACLVGFKEEEWKKVFPAAPRKA